MDHHEYRNIMFLLRTGERPTQYKGKINNSRYQQWKKMVLMNYFVHDDFPTQLLRGNKDDLTRMRFDTGIAVSKLPVRRVVLHHELGDLWEEFHNNNNHCRLWGVYNSVRQVYYVKNMREWIEHNLQQCKACNFKKNGQDNYVPHYAVLPKKPLEIWQVDFIGSFPADSQTGSKWFCVVIDCMSKILWGEDFITCTFERFSGWFDELLGEEGNPTLVQCDNASIFKDNFGQWLHERGIEIRHSEPGRANQNGQVERANGTVKHQTTRTIIHDIITTVQNRLGVDLPPITDEDILISKNWVSKMKNHLVTYNHLPKNLTKFSPHAVHYGVVDIGYRQLQGDSPLFDNIRRMLAVPDGYDESTRENFWNYIYNRQKEAADKYLQRAAERQPQRLPALSVGDNVFIAKRPSIFHKPKFGKPYYPYFGTVHSIRPSTDSYRVIWGSVCPPGCREGALSEYYARSLLNATANAGEESCMLAVQFIQQADSRNTRQGNHPLFIIRERFQNNKWECLVIKRDYTFVWVLAATVQDAPAWKPFRDKYLPERNETPEQHARRRINERRTNAARELERDQYTIEFIVTVRQQQALVVWLNFEEPTWEPLRLVNNTAAMQEYEDRVRERENRR